MIALWKEAVMRLKLFEVWLLNGVAIGMMWLAFEKASLVAAFLCGLLVGWALGRLLDILKGEGTTGKVTLG